VGSRKVAAGGGLCASRQDRSFKNMPSEEIRDRVIEIIIVAQMSVILMAVMFYYFVGLPRLPKPASSSPSSIEQKQCEAQSSPVVQKSVL
jgi:hypothetical protein